jgi:hypothetical protein
LAVLDLCFNPIQKVSYYQAQLIYLLPQITILDGKTLNCVDFVKSENFFGKDLEARKRIFESILPEETFIDRRIHAADFLDPESGSEIEEDIEFVDKYDKEGRRIQEPIKNRTGQLSVL